MPDQQGNAAHRACKTWTSDPVPRGAAALDAGSRAVRYGDGVFVTLAIRRGLLLDPERQLDRLRRAARAIGLLPPGLFEDPEEGPYVLGALLEDLGADERTDGVARLQWSAPAGARGFGRPDARATAILDLCPAPAPRRPAVVLLGEGEAPLPALPRFKTCSALAQVVCERAARDLGADTGIRTSGGLLLETASANLFWIAGARLLTPSADLPLYPGSVRERVVETAGAAGVEVVEGEFEAGTLADAEALLLTNAARGVEIAVSLDARPLPEPPELALALADAVDARREAEALPLGRPEDGDASA